jgi:chemotaxis family two-component system response regulator Rcp1
MQWPASVLAARERRNSVPSNPLSGRLRVVVAEDNPADELLMRESLALRFPEVDVSVHHDGEQMMRWLDLLETEYTPRPDVILLDLNLPRFTGQQVLERLRGNSRGALIPVVIVTSSDAPNDRAVAVRWGVACYFQKPLKYDAFMKLGDLVHEILSPAASQF